MRFVFVFLIVFFLASCNNAEIGRSKDVNPQSVFFDYKIWAEEGKENVTCIFRYHFTGPNGTTLLLDSPSKVALDGENIAADSTKFTGVFYEVEKPIRSFAGRHQIVFTDVNKNQFKEEFEFNPFTVEAIPENIKRQPFKITLRNFTQNATPLRLVITDTSFRSPDVNEVILVKNAQVEISERMLRQLGIGPMSLELYREEERPVKEKTKKGGKISITYVLKREFEMGK